MADDNSKESGYRHLIAMVVLVGSFLGLIGLSVVIIKGSAEKGDYAMTKDVFNALLPVFGTWVGTLLAFYFSRENFKAAADSVTQIAKEVARVDERLRAIAVREKMRRLKDMTTWVIKRDEEDKCKLSDVLAKCANVDRIPMLDDKNCIVYLVYKNPLYQFLSQIALDPTKLGTKKAADLTLKDVMDSDAKLKQLFQGSFGLVAENATLADAKRAMETIAKTVPCNDVFVTQTGQANEPIIGWITNNTIAENSKV